MNDVLKQLETSGQGKAAKAGAWLRVHWYAFLIGAAAGALAGALAGHLFWH